MRRCCGGRWGRQPHPLAPIRRALGERAQAQEARKDRFSSRGVVTTGVRFGARRAARGLARAGWPSARVLPPRRAADLWVARSRLASPRWRVMPPRGRRRAAKTGKTTVVSHVGLHDEPSISAGLRRKFGVSWLHQTQFGACCLHEAGHCVAAQGRPHLPRQCSLTSQGEEEEVNE